MTSRELYNVSNHRQLGGLFNNLFMLTTAKPAKLRHCNSFGALQWCHNEHNGVSNNRNLDCLPNYLLRRRSNKTRKKQESSTLLAFVWEIHRWPVDSPHKGPVTWKWFPFDDVIIGSDWLYLPDFHMICNYLTVLEVTRIAALTMTIRQQCLCGCSVS